MRFEMARALVKRSEERAAWIGDDHGDPYEEALVTGNVSNEMKIALKEILDHLRSALDYCAREVCEKVGGVPAGSSIYFPIASKGFDPKDFRSRVGKLMPGILGKRPDLEPVFVSFQHFSSQENWWLSDLATLANETKHEQLSVNQVSALSTRIFRDEHGRNVISHAKADGTPYSPSVLMVMSKGTRKNSLEKGVWYQGSSNYLCLTPIDQELLTFLRAAIPGVTRIIQELEAVV